MSTIFVQNPGETKRTEVNSEHPLPVALAGLSESGALIVGSNDKVVEVVLNPYSTDALDAGDVAVTTTEIPDVFTVAGGTAVISSITVSDKSDQAANLGYFVFMNRNVSIGVGDAAPTMADDDVTAVQGIVTIAAADWLDVANSKVGCVKNVGLLLQAPADSRSLWVAFVLGVGMTPTFTANCLTLKIGLLRN